MADWCSVRAIHDRLVDGCGRVVEGALAPAVLEAASQPEHAASMTNTLKAARDRALFIGVFFKLRASSGMATPFQRRKPIQRMWLATYSFFSRANSIAIHAAASNEP
jgi:hypothetical protein